MRLLKNLFLLVFFLSMGILVANSNENPKEHKNIMYLLNEIKNCSCKFERNGDSHTAQEAYKHLKRKYDYARKPFIYWQKKTITTKDFIEKIASSSSTTGRPYFIIIKKEKIKMLDWLNKTYAEYLKTLKK